MLARIAASEYAGDFVLKGGVLLAAFALRRPTKDIDLEATRINNDAHEVATRIREIAEISRDDGIEFDLGSVRAETIRDGDEYQGIRVKLTGVIGRSENVIGLDISFGDPIWPAPQQVLVPRVLDKDQSAPIPILGYPIVMVVASHRRATLETLIPALEGMPAIAQTKWSAWRARQEHRDSIPELFSDALIQVAAFFDPVVDGSTG